MAGNFMKMAYKLQGAIKRQFNINLLINTTQWHHKDKDTFINVYTIKKSNWDVDKKKHSLVEIYHTYSQIQLVLWLRDYWYDLNGWEIPTDNETWENLKSEYGQFKKSTDAITSAAENEEQ